MTLRPYQVEARHHCYNFWRQPHQAKQPLVVIATGGGKTITALQMVYDCTSRDKRVLWLAHREELLHQPLAAYKGIWGAPAGIVQADRNEADEPFVIASVDTLRNRDIGGDFRLIVVDEAHHSMAKTYRDILDRYPDALRLGLTATPERADNKDLSELWEITYVYSMLRAIREGYLVAPRHVLERLPKLNLDDVGGREDYDDKELGKALLLAGVVEHSVEVMQKHGKGRHALLFTATVEQATLTSAALSEAGFRSRVLSGKTGKGERRSIIKGFTKGLIDVLVNCSVLTEGTDLPICDTVLICRPTRSKNLLIQQIGRCLRLYPGKDDALIVDIAGATQEHSLIQAPILFGEMEEDEKAACPDSPTGQHEWERTEPWVSRCSLCDKSRVHDPLGEGKSPLSGMHARRERVKALWHPVEGIDRRGFVCDCGKHGMIFVMEGESGWIPWWAEHRRRKPTPLSDIPVPLELAYGLGDDIVRRATALNAPKAGWRNGKVSKGAEDYMRRLRIHQREGMRAGEASDLIVARKATERAVKLKIARRGR